MNEQESRERLCNDCLYDWLDTADIPIGTVIEIVDRKDCDEEHL